MNKKTIQLNSLTDVYKVLDKDIITPDQAITICCRVLNMIDLRFENEKFTKKQVLLQIKHLDLLINKHGAIPIIFKQKTINFSISDVYIGKPDDKKYQSKVIQ